MIPIALAIVTLVALVVAQTSSTVSLWIGEFASPQNLVASVAGSDAEATSYVVGCGISAFSPVSGLGAWSTGYFDVAGNQDACGFDSPFTVVQGPSTVRYVVSAEDDIDSLDCKLMGSTQAICVESVTGSYLLANSHASWIATTLTGSELSYYVPIVITAGPTSTTPSSTAIVTSTATNSNVNAAMQGSPRQRAGLLGALGVAIAGAML